MLACRLVIKKNFNKDEFLKLTEFIRTDMIMKT